MRCRTLKRAHVEHTHSSQAFRFGTGGDVVDTHAPNIHQRCIVPLTIQHPSIPSRTLLLDYCAVLYMLLWHVA